MNAPNSPTVQWTFLALVSSQAAHSIEEYYGRLWEVFPPARFFSSLISSNLETGFLVINVSLVLFGFWCFFWPVRKRWRSSVSFVWFWIILETVNGIGHSIWWLSQGGYTPGIITAIPLLILAIFVGRQLQTHTSPG